jgi:gamma-glutamyl-gamma-aminobutyrate hydrolase PuuD
MKKIALTQRLLLNQNYFEMREALDVKWGALFKKLNFLPVILPIEFEYKEYFKSIKIDGIILTGGNDLSAINKDYLSSKRDKFEKKIIRYGIKNNIPIFGMCRGMEIIADQFGAKFKRVRGQVGIRHKLKVNEKSKYFKQLKEISTVNSFHNYAIDILPKEMIVSATNENGMIKAMEHKKYKIFGQMWHSEREKFFDKNQINLIKKFFLT